MKLQMLQNFARQVHGRLFPQPDLPFQQLDLRYPELIFRRSRITGIKIGHLENASRKVRLSPPLEAAIPGPPTGFSRMMKCPQCQVVGTKMKGTNPTQHRHDSMALHHHSGKHLQAHRFFRPPLQQSQAFATRLQTLAPPIQLHSIA
jgi:hypothetical protein